MLFADIMSIGSNDSLTIRNGIFNEFVLVEMHEDVQNIYSSKMPSGFGKTVGEL